MNEDDDGRTVHLIPVEGEQEGTKMFELEGAAICSVASASLLPVNKSFIRSG